MGDDNYTVWVGGQEVTDYYVSEQEANRIAQEYRAKGYDDVHITNPMQEQLDMAQSPSYQRIRYQTAPKFWRQLACPRCRRIVGREATLYDEFKCKECGELMKDVGDIGMYDECPSGQYLAIVQWQELVYSQNRMVNSGEPSLMLFESKQDFETHNWKQYLDVDRNYNIIWHGYVKFQGVPSKHTLPAELQKIIEQRRV